MVARRPLPTAIWLESNAGPTTSRSLPIPPRGEEAIVADTDDDGLLFEIVLELEADIVAGFKVGGQEKLGAIRFTQRGGGKRCQCCPTVMED